MSHSVERHLGVASGSYDTTIRKFIVDYEEMVGTAVRAVAAVGPGRVLDLGAGTGALSERLLAIMEETVVELWDVDDAMLGVARERLARFGDRARFIHRSFGETFPRCDAIMASLALHHIQDLGEKTALYGRVPVASWSTPTLRSPPNCRRETQPIGSGPTIWSPLELPRTGPGSISKNGLARIGTSPSTKSWLPLRPLGSERPARGEMARRP
jgi:SAM-dependent methyltransferase